MKEPVIAEIKIIPIGTATTSLSRYIAACINTIKQAQGISCQLTAMGTIIQGPLERVLELAQKMHEVPFTMGVKRVVTTINIDDRRDKSATIASKVKAVTQASHDS
ncbi:MTH1187 family thiamine-binding protein [Chloroflexota bacterium]